MKRPTSNIAVIKFDFFTVTSHFAVILITINSFKNFNSYFYGSECHMNLARPVFWNTWK
jgi:hypothetical protein